MCEEFAKREGRQPRIMIAKMGQDGHDRGAKVVATGYADCGFDVDMGPALPDSLPKQPVRLWRTTSTSSVYRRWLQATRPPPQVIEELKKLGREDIMVTPAA